jgi:hypothetical protein
MWNMTLGRRAVFRPGGRRHGARRRPLSGDGAGDEERSVWAVPEDDRQPVG